MSPKLPAAKDKFGSADDGEFGSYLECSLWVVVATALCRRVSAARRPAFCLGVDLRRSKRSEATKIELRYP
jgi:hypothetical protein